MSDLTVGVVGLGYFAQFHLRAWAKLPGVRLLGVTDLNPRAVSAAATAFNVPGHAALTGLLADDPDLIDIVAPPVAHAPLIRQVLRTGRTGSTGRLLICQKPFCTSLAEAEAMATEARAAGCRIVIHENFRFQPWHRDIRRLLSEGYLGEVYQARFSLRPGDGRGPDAYLDRQPSFQSMPRFLFHETGVHFMDLFRWFFGEVEAVYAESRRLNRAVAGEDEGLVILNHASGVRSVFDGNRHADHISDNPRRTMGEMLIEGERGTLRLDGAGRIWHRRFGESSEQQVPLSHPVDETSFGGGCVAALIAHVAEAVQAGAVPENMVEDYLPVIRLTEAAYQSASEGRRVLVR